MIKKRNQIRDIFWIKLILENKKRLVLLNEKYELIIESLHTKDTEYGQLQLWTKLRDLINKLKYEKYN